MTVEQMMASMLAFAIVLAALNVLVGASGIATRLAHRRRPQPNHPTDDSRDVPPTPTSRTRRERSQRPALRNLNTVERAHYVNRWRLLHRRANALPATTLLDADDLLTHMLDDIGYPTDGFVQYAAELSPVHADVVDDYRAARNVALDTKLGLADTAQIRHAIPRYVAVFECLTDADITTHPNEAAA